jgi:hypothetical protein
LDPVDAVECITGCKPEARLARRDLLDIYIRAMARDAQKRAVETYRSRQAGRGIARFEIQAPDSDRELLRALARKLARNGAEATRLRQLVRQAVSGDGPTAGGILAALRRSPLAGAGLDLSRDREEARDTDP